MYNSNQLIISDQHPYKILEYSQSIILITNYKMIVILKIPILKPTSYPLYKMLPIPNTDELMILPPADFLSNNIWFKDCTQINEEKYLCQNEIHSKCTPSVPQRCLIVEMKEDVVHQMKSQALIASSPRLQITDQCTGEEVQPSCHTVIISNNCPISINKKIFNVNQSMDLDVPEIYIHALSPSHTATLDTIPIPKDLHLQPIEPIHLKTSLFYVNWTLILLIFILMIPVTFLIIRKRKRISNFLFRSKVPLKQLEKILQSTEGGVTEKSRHVTPDLPARDAA